MPSCHHTKTMSSSMKSKTKSKSHFLHQQDNLNQNCQYISTRIFYNNFFLVRNNKFCDEKNNSQVLTDGHSILYYTVILANVSQNYIPMFTKVRNTSLDQAKFRSFHSLKYLKTKKKKKREKRKLIQGEFSYYGQFKFVFVSRKLSQRRKIWCSTVMK